MQDKAHIAIGTLLFTEKLELVNWDEYKRLVADAYDKAPEYDERAVPAYQAMLSACDRFFKMIGSKVKVEFVDGDPYTSQQQMKQEVAATKVLKVMKDFSDHPLFTKEQNWKFRAVHDWFTHILTNQPFTLEGELKAYNTHLKMFPPASYPALFTEIVGQVCYQTSHGSFPTQKVCVLDGFDYKNLGHVEGHTIQNKQLMRNDASTNATG